MELGYITKLYTEEGKHRKKEVPYNTDDTSTLFVGANNRNHKNLERLFLNDVHVGKPAVYFGDSESILDKMPKDRHQDVQLIKPSLQPFALNILADKHPKIHSVLLDFLKGYWDYGKLSTPNLDMYVRASIQTVAFADKTFLHIDKLLSDENYRSYLLSLREVSDQPKLAPRKIKNPLLRGFWEQYNLKNDKDRQNETASTETNFGHSYSMKKYVVAWYKRTTGLTLTSS